MGKIFINYRRGDEPGFAGRLFDRLEQAFAPDQLFMDVDNIAPGQDFARVLEHQVSQCDVLIVIIGQTWIDARDAASSRRLENPDDYVRIEIEAGLQQGKRVIPVLINNATMPSPELLPETLRPMAFRHAVRLTHDRFRTDAQGVVSAINAALQDATEERRRARDAAALEQRRRRTEASRGRFVGWPLAGVLGLLALLGVGALFYVQSRRDVVVASAEPPRAALDDSDEALKAPVLSGFKVTSATIDRSLQATALWRLVKKEFPDWYGQQLQQAAKLVTEGKSEDEVGLALIRSLIGLRRAHAQDGLAASEPLIKEVASTFLVNLKELKKHGADICYGFIAQGESHPRIVGFLQGSEHTQHLQRQLLAVFEAIADGKKHRHVYPGPKRADYDGLAADLTKLGWSKADMTLFTDAKALNEAPPAKVCDLVHDWFTALLAVNDPAARARLLADSIKPVIAG